MIAIGIWMAHLAEQSVTTTEGALIAAVPTGGLIFMGGKLLNQVLFLQLREVQKKSQTGETA